MDFLGIFSAIKRWAYGLAAAALLFLGALAYGRRQGEKAGAAEAVDATAEATQKAVEIRNKVEADTARRSDADVIADLQKNWARKQTP